LTAEERRTELLFLLSSADRVRMLTILRDEKKLRLSRLSSMTSMTVQEASRQVGRLQSARLVERDPRGLYLLTGLGRIALEFVPPFTFLAERRDYLLSHDLSSLPPEFVERIGELAKGEYSDALRGVLEHLQEVLSGSAEYIWLMADQLLLGGWVTDRVLNGDGVPLRIILPSSVAADLDPRPDQFRGKVELGLVERVEVAMALSESVAGVAFPDLTGRLDFDKGLRSRDPLFHAWCSDLFEHHWGRVRRVL
jgi:predicted transcriptional regulator